jgi:putative chitinase
MSAITAQQIRMAAKGPVDDGNLNSVLVALDQYGAALGMGKPHRDVEYLAQLMHESGDFRFDREVWGPTPAQKKYDTRADLGNTRAADGDGKLYRGRTGIEITGRANYAAFRDWCKAKGFNPPDFVKAPDAVNTDPWEGLAPLWFWETRNLNRYADQGDIETITKRINGGMTGFADRVDHFVRLSLVVLGYDADALKEFQTMAKRDGSYAGPIDGDAGPKTRAALHLALVRLTPGAAASPAVKFAPVTEVKPVVPAAVEQQVRGKTNLFAWIFGGGFSGMSMMSALSGADWRTVGVIAGIGVVTIGLGLIFRHQLIAAVKEIRQAAES